MKQKEWYSRITAANDAARLFLGNDDLISKWQHAQLQCHRELSLPANVQQDKDVSHLFSNIKKDSRSWSRIAREREEGLCESKVFLWNIFLSFLDFRKVSSSRFFPILFWVMAWVNSFKLRNERALYSWIIICYPKQIIDKEMIKTSFLFLQWLEIYCKKNPFEMPQENMMPLPFYQGCSWCSGDRRPSFKINFYISIEWENVWRCRCARDWRGC